MLMNGSLRVVALASTLLVLACSEATGPEPRFTANLAPGEFAVVTSEAGYALRVQSAGILEGEIPFTFTNVSDHTVFLPNCLGAFRTVLEKWQEDRWVPAWAGMLAGCASPTIELGPGEALPYAMAIFAGYGETILSPRYEAPVEGTYRIAIESAYWDLDEDTGTRELLPERLRVSNEFTLRLE